MVHIESNFRIIAISGTYTVNTGKELENNDLLHEFTSSATHAHGFVSSYQTGPLTVKYIANITAITGNVDISVTILIRPSGQILATKLITVSSIDLYTIETSINLGGVPNGPPTYLEQLYKLDNYTKPQYIPRYRR